MSHATLRIDGDRLWARLEALGEVGQCTVLPASEGVLGWRSPTPIAKGATSC